VSALSESSGEKRSHQIGTDRAVEADGERIVVPHRVPKRADGLRRDHRLAAATDGCGDHEREFDLSSAKNFLDRDERGLGVERIENRLDEQQVHPAGNERAHLAAIVGFALVEGDDAETRIIGIGELDNETVSGPSAPAT